MKEANADEVQRLNANAETLVKLRQEQDDAAASAELLEDEAEAIRAANDSKKISDLERLIKKNAKDMEYANNHQRHLMEVAGKHKRNAEQAQKELEILAKQSGTDKKTLAEAQKRVEELNVSANASAQAYNN